MSDIGPAYKHWDRSKVKPEMVLVPLHLWCKEHGYGIYSCCSECVFGNKPNHKLCESHACGKGLWLHEAQAAQLRLEDT